MDNDSLENNLNGSKETANSRTDPKKKKVFVSTKVKKVQNWSEKEDEVLMRVAKKYGYKNWKEVSLCLPGRTAIQCSARYKRIRPGIVKGAWTVDEDNILMSYIKKFGKNWSLISKYMPSRSGKQIRDRFLNALDPNIMKDKFTADEDSKIIEMYEVYGTQWSRIAKHIERRTGDMIKNRFYSTLRKLIHADDYRSQLLKRKTEREGEVKQERASSEDSSYDEYKATVKTARLNRRGKRRRVIKDVMVKKEVKVEVKVEKGLSEKVIKPQVQLKSASPVNPMLSPRTNPAIIGKSSSSESNPIGFNAIYSRGGSSFKSSSNYNPLTNYKFPPSFSSSMSSGSVNNEQTKPNENNINDESAGVVNKDDLENQLNSLKQFLFLTHSKLSVFQDEPTLNINPNPFQQINSNILKRALQLNIAQQINSLSTQLHFNNQMNNLGGYLNIPQQQWK